MPRELKYKHTMDTRRCKGCGLCIEVCPAHVLEMSSELSALGCFPAYQARPKDCIFCTACCIMCPDVAIAISETEDNEGHKTEQK
jgi:2-oxoglutarate ferredoxin oxidoreductase subunit delta